MDFFLKKILSKIEFNPNEKMTKRNKILIDITDEKNRKKERGETV